MNYGLQAFWVLAAIYVVQLYIFSIRPGYATLTQVCTEPICSGVQVSTQGLQSLTRLGISLRVFAISEQILIFGATAVYATVSLLIFRAKRHDNVAIYVALVLLLYGAFVSDYVDILRDVQPQFADLIDVLPGLTLIAFAILCYVFPDGRFVPRWTRWAAWSWIIVPTILVVATVFDAYDQAIGPIGIVLLAMLATCIIAPIIRYRRLTSYAQRQQLKWVLFGLTQFLAMLMIGGELQPLIFPTLDVIGTLPSIILNLLEWASLTLFPVTVGIALLRYRLWNVDLVINRTLVYVPLTSILTVIYTTSIAVSQRLFITATGEQPQAVAIFTTIILTTTFSPIKNALQAYVDKNFKEAHVNLKELKELDQQIAQVVQALDHRSLAQRVVEAIVNAYNAKGAALYLLEPDAMDQPVRMRARIEQTRFEQGSDDPEYFEQDGDGINLSLAYATPSWVWEEGELSILLAQDDVIFGRLLLGQRNDRDDYSLDEIETIRATTVPIVAKMYRLMAIRDNGEK